jgi:hypothetical protein
MNSLYLRLCVCIVIISAGQIFCDDSHENEDPVSSKQDQKVIPEWVKEAIGDSDSYSDDLQTTTKRPQIGDVLGQGLQGILQGIVRAPSDIANRVQEILDGIIRRPTTQPPVAPTKPSTDRRRN